MATALGFINVASDPVSRKHRVVLPLILGPTRGRPENPRELNMAICDVPVSVCVLVEVIAPFWNSASWTRLLLAGHSERDMV